MRLVFHVGLHKTGTTTLQRSVFPGMKGIVYFGRDGRPVLGTSLLESGGDTLLYSDETILGRLLDLYSTTRPQRESWAQMQIKATERLAARFPEAEIIVTLRRHESWLGSIYKHYLRYGGSLPFAQFFDVSGNAVVAPDDLMLAERVEGFRRAFGGRVHVMWLEDLIQDPEASVRRLASFLGCDGPVAAAVGRENEGVGLRGARWLQFLNRLPVLGGADHLDRRDWSARCLRSWRMTPFQIVRRTGKVFPRDGSLALPDACVQFMAEYFKEDLDRVKALTANSVGRELECRPAS